MKTHTSKKLILVKTILVIPLIAFLLFSFSTKEEVSKNIIPQVKTFYQDIATEKMVKEYNKLAKKFNALPKNERTISREELGRMVYIFDRMTKEQRHRSEEFPEIIVPENAPPPPMPTSDPYFKGSVPPPPPPNAVTPAPQVEIEIFDMNGDSELIPPPPPPVPSEHMKQLADEGAEFYLEGKKITAEEAIKLVKSNKLLTIDVRKLDAETTVVKLTKEGVKH